MKLIVISVLQMILLISCVERDQVKSPVLEFRKQITHPQLACITGLAGNQDFYLVTDWKLNQVLMFDTDDNFIRTLGGPGKGPGEFGKLTDISLDQSGDVYLTDQSCGRIQCFDKDGEFIKTLKTEYPNFGIAVNSQGNIFLNTLSPSYSILELDPEGAILSEFEGIAPDENIMLSILANISRLKSHKDLIFKTEYNSPVVYKLNSAKFEPVFRVKGLGSYRKIDFRQDKDQTVIDRGSVVISDIVLDHDLAIITGGGGQAGAELPHYLLICGFPQWDVISRFWPPELPYNEDGYALHKHGNFIYLAGINENLIYKYELLDL